MIMKTGTDTLLTYKDEEAITPHRLIFHKKLSPPHRNYRWDDISTDGLRQIAVSEVVWPANNLMPLPNTFEMDQTGQTLYSMRWFVPPCLCCGQNDHALASILGMDNNLVTERVTCPVSLFNTSLKEVIRLETKQVGIIHPWKFANQYDSEKERTTAWSTYLILGYGRRQSMAERLHYERAIKFFSDKSNGTKELHNNDNSDLIPTWTIMDKWTPAGPLLCDGENPFCRIPCVWCGSQTHSVYTEVEDNNTTARTCPLYLAYNNDENFILLTCDLIADMSSYITTQVDEIIDKFQFQGLGWLLDLNEIEQLRCAAKLRCDEERTGWTFKRDMTRLDEDWTTWESPEL